VHVAIRLQPHLPALQWVVVCEQQRPQAAQLTQQAPGRLAAGGQTRQLQQQLVLLLLLLLGVTC
jgi:hypothetical protein